MSRKGGIFENEWFQGVEDGQARPVTQPGSMKSLGDETPPPTERLRRTSSLDVTPQLPTGFSQGDEAKIADGEAIEEEEEDSNSLSLRRTASRASQKSVPGQPDRRLYYAKKSAHMSQSDFGILFPRSARYLTKVDDSEGVLDLNIRAIVEFMRERGAKVAPFATGEGKERDVEIFGEEAVAEWELVSLELGEEGKKEKTATTTTEVASKGKL